MNSLEISEQNPAPPRPVYRRAAYAAVAAQDRAARTIRERNLHPKLILSMLILHAIHAVMVYFYAQTVAHPLPRGVINRTYRGLMTFTAFTYILGFLVGIIEARLVMAFLFRRYGVPRANGWCAWLMRSTLFWTIGAAVMIFFFLGGVIFSQVALIPAYKHACDNDWITVLLQGHSYNHPKEPNRAVFSLSATKEHLFTFTSQDPDSSRFNLVSLDSERPSVLPALRNITFDDPRLAVSGFCYGENAATPCMSGRYDPIAFLSFDVTTNGTRARSRSVYREWTLDDDLSVILRRVDEDGNMTEERVLQTSPGRPGNCRQIKVCVAHPSRPQEESVLGADILVAVGWLLGIQGEASIRCSTPQSPLAG